MSQDISNSSKKRGTKRLTDKGIRGRVERILEQEDPRKFQRMRNRLACDIVVNIAAGRIKRPEEAAQVALDALTRPAPEKPAESAPLPQ